MDRKKGALKMIENEEERRVVFERLRKELLEEAAAISSETGANFNFVGFTPDGKAFNFGSSSDGKMFERFISEEKVNEMLAANKDQVMISEEESDSEIESDSEEEQQAEEKSDEFWWDNIDMEKLDTPEKVEAVKKALLEAKNKVSEKRQKLASGAATGSTGQQH
ncbi:hypothetical protein C5167_019434 [Papaver somniferum]|uniref:MADS-box domain-containing protein n=1 Tax=Papaver somniferum TaxID=3469 RepID=A0A4Y7IU53_PAPSO|nr:agamous-like MADS-box protein AGL29 [Papaver somniferum]RZC51008.1 hypothetical protein C5167_019434 [Papaver somniferum]